MEWSLTQNKLLAYHRLMRTDKPIGALLLLWPTLWALWVATPGLPPLWILAVFVAGVWLMRAAGCVVNDADRKFDGHVKRTANRPLPSGEVTEKEARTLFVVLVLLSSCWCYPQHHDHSAVGCGAGAGTGSIRL
jgi:4-hydroxybenzoate polyprenyltransferase